MHPSVAFPRISLQPDLLQVRILYALHLGYFSPRRTDGALGQGFSIRHMPHMVPGGEDGINAHYLLSDTSSGQMSSEQSLAGTHSHGKFSCNIVIKLYAVCWHDQWHNHDGCTSQRVGDHTSSATTESQICVTVPCTPWRMSLICVLLG